MRGGVIMVNAGGPDVEKLIRFLNTKSIEEIKEYTVMAAAGGPGNAVAVMDLHRLLLSGSRTAVEPYNTGVTFSKIRDWMGGEWERIEGALVKIRPVLCGMESLRKLWEEYVKDNDFVAIVTAITKLLPKTKGIPPILIDIAVYVAVLLVKYRLPMWCSW
jgi:hypothetical protein